MLFHHGFPLFTFFKAVTVTNDDFLPAAFAKILVTGFQQLLDSLLLAADLCVSYQLTVFRYINQRLDGKQGTNNGRSVGKPAASSQPFEIIDQEPMCNLGFIFLCPGNCFFIACTLICHFNKMFQQQGKTHGNASGIENFKPGIRELFHNHFSCIDGVVIGSRNRTVHINEQNRLVLGNKSLEELIIVVSCDLGSIRHLAFTHGFV